MYLHIGNNELINFKEIIAILDYNLLDKVNQDFFKKKELNFDSRKARRSCWRSAVITDTKIFLSPIAPDSLYHRIIYFRKELRGGKDGE